METKHQKLAITSRVLDVLGFSEYHGGAGEYGDRRLYFKDANVCFEITEVDEQDDEDQGYNPNGGKYVSRHWFYYNNGGRVNTDYHDLFFLHQMHECLKKYHPECVEEFNAKCKKLWMSSYLPKSE